MSDRKPTGAIEYTCLEAYNHVQFTAECNAMGARRWDLVHVEGVHGFLVGFFKRAAVDGEDVEPMLTDRTGGGVLASVGPMQQGEGGA